MASLLLGLGAVALVADLVYTAMPTITGLLALESDPSAKDIAPRDERAVPRKPPRAVTGRFPITDMFQTFARPLNNVIIPDPNPGARWINPAATLPATFVQEYKQRVARATLVRTMDNYAKSRLDPNLNVANYQTPQAIRVVSFSTRRPVASTCLLPRGTKGVDSFRRGHRLHEG